MELKLKVRSPHISEDAKEEQPANTSKSPELAKSPKPSEELPGKSNVPLLLGLGVVVLGSVILAGSYFLPILRMVDGQDVFLFSSNQHRLVGIWMGLVSLGALSLFAVALGWILLAAKPPPRWLFKTGTYLVIFFVACCGLLLHLALLLDLPSVFWASSKIASVSQLNEFVGVESVRMMRWAAYAIAWWFPALLLGRALFLKEAPRWQLVRSIWLLGIVYLVWLFVFYLIILQSPYNKQHLHSFGYQFTITTTNHLFIMFLAAVMLIAGGLVAEFAIGHPDPAMRSFEWKTAAVVLVLAVVVLLGYRFSTLPNRIDDELKRSYYPQQTGIAKPLSIFELGPSAIPVLLERLQGSKWKMRYAAARASEPFLLRKIHFQQIKTTLLASATSDPVPPVRIMALQVLGLLQSKPSKQFVIERTLLDPDEEVRVAGFHILAKKDATPVLPMLLKAIRKDIVEIRKAAIWGLDKWKKQKSMVVYGLIKALNDQRESVWRTAAAGLEKDPTLEVAVAALTSALRDYSEEIRRKATKALAQMGPLAVGALPVLLMTFQEGDEETKLLVAETVGKFGYPAKSAASFFRTFLRKNRNLCHPNPQLCKTVRDTIKKIRTKPRKPRPLPPARIN